MEDGVFDFTDRMLGLVAGTLSVNFSIFIQYVCGYYFLFYILVQWYLICSGIFLIIYSTVGHRKSDIPVRTVIRLVFTPISIILVIHAILVPLKDGLYSDLIIAASISYIVESIFDDRIFLFIRSGKTGISRISGPLVAGILAVAVYLITSLSGYTYAAFAVLALSIFLSAYSSVRPISQRIQYAPIIAGIIVLAASAIAVTQGFMTDELLYDFLSARVILHGGNPYLVTNLSEFLNTYHVPLSARTFLTDGQYASGFYYPALAAIAFIPSVFLQFDPRIEILLFTAGIFIALYLATGRNSPENRPLVMALFLLADMGAVLSAGTSIVDPIWAFFLTLSFMTRKRSSMSAVLLGASLATKQLSWIFVPFYMVFIKQEKDLKETVKYFSIAFLSFTLLNMPYMIISPGKWFTAMISPEMLQFLGAGQGLGALSFAGFLPLSRTYFMVIAVAAGLILLWLYWRYRGLMKYAIAAIPMIIMFLNYRMFLNYLIFWPLVSAVSVNEMTAVPESQETAGAWHYGPVNIGRKALGPMAVAVILIVAIGAGLAPVMHDSGSSSLSISNVDVITSSGNVTEIMVLATPNSFGDSLQFRVFPSEVNSHTYLSGSLWNLTAFSATQSVYQYKLVPMNTEQEFPAGMPFRLEIYRGSVNYFINISG